MKTDVSLRNDMLTDVIKASIDLVPNPTNIPAVGGPGGMVNVYKSIVFREAGGEIVCVLPFSDVQEKGATGQNAVLEFKAPDGTTALKSGVIFAGNPKTFEIYGNASPAIIMNGSVGTITSADIRFNQVDWQLTTFVTLTDATIEIKQGV
jgi:hypothetical protein